MVGWMDGWIDGFQEQANEQMNYKIVEPANCKNFRPIGLCFQITNSNKGKKHAKNMKPPCRNHLEQIFGGETSLHGFPSHHRTGIFQILQGEAQKPVISRQSYRYNPYK